MTSYNKNIIISLGVNLILFWGLWLFFCPIYHSRDDVFLLYLLCGGFGNTPTELLHYNYGMHPLLGVFLKYFFVAWPNTNWLSLSIVVLLAISGLVLFYILLQQQKRVVAFTLYLLFFLIVLCWSFLHLNFSVVSSVSAMAAAGLLFYYSKNNKMWFCYVWPLLLLILASFFRIHTIIPVAIVLAPLFFTVASKTGRLKFVTTLFFACVLIFALNKQHVAYYKKHIPGWEKEEVYRQAAFNFVNQDIGNKAKDQKKKTAKNQMLSYRLFFDKDYFDLESIRGMNKGYVHKTFKEIKVALTWVVIENKVFLLLLFFIGIITFFYFETKNRIWVASSLFVALLLMLFLLLYLKLPYYIVPVLIGSLVAGFIALAPPISIPPKKMYFSLFIALLLLSYSFIRLHKMNSANKQKKAIFNLAVNQFSSRKDSFFVLIDPGFPIDYFPATSSPVALPLTNVIFNGHFINNEADKMLKRNGIEGLQDLWKNKKVLIWSLPSKNKLNSFNTFLKLYLQEKHNAIVSFSIPLSGYQYGEIRKIYFTSPKTP